MDPRSVVFLISAAIMLFAALRVITARNSVHAVLYLVLAFFSAASLWLLLKAEFLAIALVLVYVGAVMVLFLFVVMMLDINAQRLRSGFWKAAPLAAVVAGLIIAQLVAVLTHAHWQATVEPAGDLGLANNIEVLGQLTYSVYVFPLQIAGALLLVAIVSAIALTLRQRKDSKHQDPAQQVKVRRADRVRLVDVPNQAQARQDVRSSGSHGSAEEGTR
ncbi:MAG TPA: NADH-quinone oxidoreductase subunit J [Burkholderiaceae bacterium]|nr:NADH-quinone oxidoreductase subunit J [Burkholderiaceae bacterium]